MASAKLPILCQHTLLLIVCVYDDDDDIQIQLPRGGTVSNKGRLRFGCGGTKNICLCRQHTITEKNVFYKVSVFSVFFRLYSLMKKDIQRQLEGFINRSLTVY